MFSIADVSAFFTPGVCMMGTPSSLVSEQMHPNHSRRGGRLPRSCKYDPKISATLPFLSFPKTLLICWSWFARVVKGGDLRSPALKCAWVQTPQPTYSLHSLLNVLNCGVKPQNQIRTYILYYISWIRRVVINFLIHIH